MAEHYDALLRHLREIRNLNRAAAVLNWDRETYMPAGGADARASQLATLSRLGHQMFTSDDTARLLDAAASEVAAAEPDSDPARMVSVVREDYHDATKLPTEFVAAFTELASKAQHVWAEARAKNDYALFKPLLAQIIDMTRRQADYLGYTDHPYDALLNDYDRGMTTAQVRAIFAGLKPQQQALIAAIAERGTPVDDAPLRQPFSVAQQRAFGEMVAAAVGYDFNRGRLDVSVHPFSISLDRDDSRITTRFDEHWLNPALFGTLHEAGHSMYEQGIGDALARTMLGSGTSLSVHESQSRLWENLVGRSRGFWTWALPRLQAAFPGQFDGIDVDTFYRAINKVDTGNFIRVEADEATYNLHIILRFELEQAMITGEVGVDDIPRQWNERFEASFGVTPPTDTLGCLQDIHWSMGGIGYFSTYALGNLLSVQYYQRALADHPAIPDEVARGEFSTLRTWLNTHIHAHGRKFTTDELTRRVTGTGIDAQPYADYLAAKFSDVYQL